MTWDPLSQKPDQARSGFDLLHQNKEVKKIVWFGTEPLPTSGLGNQIRVALEGAGIAYEVIK